MESFNDFSIYCEYFLQFFREKTKNKQGSPFVFSKCSTRFTIYLENHKIFGSIIMNWKLYRGLSRRAKKIAIVTIIPTFLLTIYITFNLIGDLIFGFFGIALCTWLATRPEPPIQAD